MFKYLNINSFEMKRVGIVILLCICAIVAQAQDIEALLYEDELFHEQPEMALGILNRALKKTLILRNY